MNIWHELGIPPASASAIIRRAYAAKLRDIDVDNNPAAFMALRAAFEAAMAQAATPPAQAKGGDDEIKKPNAEKPTNYVDNAIFTTSPAQPQPEPPETLLQAALKTSGTWGAFECYNQLLARGDITLYNQDTLAHWLIDEAVHDYALSPENFLHMVASLGFADLRRQHDDDATLNLLIIQRVQAAHWLFGLRVTAAQPARWRKKHKVKAARLMLGKRKRLGRNGHLLAALKPLFTEYHAHAASLGPEIDHEALIRLETKLTRTLKSTRRNANLLFALFVAFLMGDTIYVVSTNLYSWFMRHH